MSTKKKTPLPNAPPSAPAPAAGIPRCARMGCTTPSVFGMLLCADCAERYPGHQSERDQADCGPTHTPRAPHGCPLNKQGERHCNCCEACTSVCEQRAAAGIGNLCSPTCTCTPYRAPELQCDTFKRLVEESAPKWVASASGPIPGAAPPAAPAGLPPEVVSLLTTLAPMGAEFGIALGRHAKNPRTLRYLASVLTETARFIEDNQRAKLEQFCVDEGIETADVLQR